MYKKNSFVSTNNRNSGLFCILSVAKEKKGTKEKLTMDEALTSMAAGLNGKDKHTAATVAEWWGGAKGGLT